jgi:predicted RNA-binding protein with TRAM domain
MSIRELKRQPVKVGEEIVADVTDIHVSGAGVGHTEAGFAVFVDGVLPDARARVKITSVKSNHARADELERLPMEDEDEPEEPGEGAEVEEADEAEERPSEEARPHLGSRDNFWGS